MGASSGGGPVARRERGGCARPRLHAAGGGSYSLHCSDGQGVWLKFRAASGSIVRRLSLPRCMGAAMARETGAPCHGLVAWGQQYGRKRDPVDLWRWFVDPARRGVGDFELSPSGDGIVL